MFLFPLFERIKKGDILIAIFQDKINTTLNQKPQVILWLTIY